MYVCEPQAHIGCYIKIIIIWENGLYTDQLYQNKVKVWLSDKID